MRSSTADVLVRLNSYRELTLDQALEFVSEDEQLEVTPDSVRLRKLELGKVERRKDLRLARK
jgi:GTP-binding protein